MSKHIKLLLTCEHGGHRVPKRYSHLFRGQARLLNSHRGFDFGALSLAQRMAKALPCPLIANTTTRLLVDLNRRATNRTVFSEITRALDPAARAHLLANYHTPHRAQIAAWVEKVIASNQPVLHIGVHSFTPRLEGIERKADVGLLYDPARAGERVLCQRWKAGLANAAPNLHIRCNYPYRGTSDGVPAWLRQTYSNDCYWGIELEVSYRCLAQNATPDRLFKPLLSSLAHVISTMQSKHLPH